MNETGTGGRQGGGTPYATRTTAVDHARVQAVRSTRDQPPEADGNCTAIHFRDGSRYWTHAPPKV